MKLIYVVRRFGPAGGMERYVWETVCELHLLGHEVKVLCETCLVEPPHGMTVHELGTSPARPRWKALWRFSKRVECWLKEHPHPGWLVHSHERLGCHHITTYHGQPFATVFEKHWSRWLSLRVVMQLYMERRELSVAQWIVPVSQLNRQQLAHYYPQFAHKLTAPIEPGVAGSALRAPHSVPPDGGVVGFVGREWQRKGLHFAIAVVERLRRLRPHLVFLVLGPLAAEVQPLFAHWQEGYELMGWALEPDYARFDVLLHPAQAEPYGMVITEAMAAQVPVVVSNRCGAAAHVRPDAGTVLALTDPVDVWADAIERQLGRRTPVPFFVRTWREVAQAYETRYQATNCANPVPALYSRPKAAPVAGIEEFKCGSSDQDRIQAVAAGRVVAHGTGVLGQPSGGGSGVAGVVAGACVVGAPDRPARGTAGVHGHSPFAVGAFLPAGRCGTRR